MEILNLSGIKKSFGATVALDGVNLRLEKGSVHALIGENGAGKSTLMNVLSGAIRPDSGEMELRGKSYAPANTLDARENRIALIHQELSLAPHLSVAENILMGMENSRFGWLNRRALHERAAAVLKNFNHPAIQPETTVENLPIAARQVVEICRAVAARAEIILMDEPTSSLSRDDVKQLFALIRNLQMQDISIIYISHFLEEIREIADDFTVLRDGKSVASGKIADAKDDYLIAQMVGRAVDNLFPPRTKFPNGETILEVRNLAAPPMLQAASLELKRGEILGIAGLMGSGRSELIKAIFGLEKAAAGSVSLDRQIVSNSALPAQKLAKGLGYLSEDRQGEGLAVALSIADNLTMTGFAACSKYGWLNLSKQKRQAETVIKNIGVKTRTATQAVATLSGGNQQKVAVGRLIHQDADVLLLDEPTRGIDIGSKAQVYQTIADLAARGKAILFVSSYLPELFGMCDRLAVMNRGRLSAALPIEKWSPESVMSAAIETGEN